MRWKKTVLKPCARCGKVQVYTTYCEPCSKVLANARARDYQKRTGWKPAPKTTHAEAKPVSQCWRDPRFFPDWKGPRARVEEFDSAVQSTMSAWRQA